MFAAHPDPFSDPAYPVYRASLHCVLIPTLFTL